MPFETTATRAAHQTQPRATNAASANPNKAHQAIAVAAPRTMGRETHYPAAAAAMLDAGSRTRKMTDADLTGGIASTVVIHQRCSPSPANGSQPSTAAQQAGNESQATAGDDGERRLCGRGVKIVSTLVTMIGLAGTGFAAWHAAGLEPGREREGAVMAAGLAGLFTALTCCCACLAGGGR